MANLSGCTNPPGYVITPPGYAGPIFRDDQGRCFPYDVDGSISFYGQYGYNPSAAAGIVFLCLFAFLTAVHLVLNVLSRRLWLVTTVIGGVGELIGWAGRYMSSQPNANDFSQRAERYFLMNVISLSICPTFFSATCYGLFVLIVRDLGPDRARIRPRIIAITSIIVDALAILIQGAGGGLAGGAKDFAGAQRAARVLLAGIALQLACMVIFSAFAIDYILRVRRTVKWTQRRSMLVGGLLAASVCIIIRSAFRVAELKDGFLGTLAKDEPIFLGLDPPFMVLCMIALAVAHPAITFPRRRSRDAPLDVSEKL